MGTGNAMTEKICARCDRHLRRTNTDPDGLCGYCARSGVGVGKPSSQARAAWRKAGRPRVPGAAPRPRPARNGHRHHGPKLPDPRTVPATYLIQCRDEIQRRAKEARQILGALGEGFTPASLRLRCAKHNRDLDERGYCASCTTDAVIGSPS